MFATAASVQLSPSSFLRPVPCFGIRQTPWPIAVGPPKSIAAVLQKEKKIENGIRPCLPRYPDVRGAMDPRNLDGVQPFDYESKRPKEIENNSMLKIGILGFGNFGQFLAKSIVSQGHTVLAYSRTDHSEVASKMGVSFNRDQRGFCEEHPDVVLLCSSIISTESVLRSLPIHRLKRNTLFVDVLSVKEFPRSLFLELLPPEFDIVCTHPMFGPESGKCGWTGLPLVYEKVRVGEGLRAHERCERFLNIFAKEGCRMVEMSCAEHDRIAAETQFLTHTVGRMLGELNLKYTTIDTKGYESLLRIINNTCGDSFDLYYGLFTYNVNAAEQLERLEMAFHSLKKQLVGPLHNSLRSTKIFDGISRGQVCEQNLAPIDLQNSTPCDAIVPAATSK